MPEFNLEGDNEIFHRSKNVLFEYIWYICLHLSYRYTFLYIIKKEIENKFQEFA